jgi:glycosyltransferase involved in cell wall biosynthesis
VNLDPTRTVFVILSFEGPDVFSQAGGLGVRVKGLSRTLARLGYPTYLYFCGDPTLPGEEEVEGGRLHLRRWCQWISAQHPGGVYEGEEGKIRDWNSSLPASLIDNVIEPAVAEDKHVIVLGEEWHTSWSMRLISDTLYYRGIRDRVVMLWNANNTYSFNRIDWAPLNLAATVTTVSRYMKFRMWEWNQNPIVIPNGIPAESIVEPDAAVVASVRSAAGAGVFWFKIGRFDPDKRWLMAVSAAAELKRRGERVKLMMRGGREPHGTEVLGLAQHLGLAVRDVPAQGAAGRAGHRMDYVVVIGPRNGCAFFDGKGCGAKLKTSNRHTGRAWLRRYRVWRGGLGGCRSFRIGSSVGRGRRINRHAGRIQSQGGRSRRVQTVFRNRVLDR